MDEFLLINPSLESGESMDDSEEENESSHSRTEFDRRLPITHSYLGNRAQGELSSESIFIEPGQTIKVPVLLMHEVCLLPGQSSPLQFYAPASVQFFNDPAHQRNFCALMTIKEIEVQRAEDIFRLSCHPVGTLFQIQNALVKQEGMMTLQVIGRQRCALVSPINHQDIHCEDISAMICDNIEVTVLEEKLLSKEIFSFTESECNSWNRFPDKQKSEFFAALSPHNPTTLRQLSTEGMVQRLRNWLFYWFKQRQIDLVIDQGLTIFSFWVAANIPMSLEEKLEILHEDSTDRRLRIAWRIVSQMNSIVCDGCDQPKCKVSDIINLSVEGNSTHFVNPGGFVHDLFTVKRVEGIELEGVPTKEFSWFPGYEWTILRCTNCGSHIGWRFTSTNLIPRQFYGISRRSFRLVSPKEEEQQQ